ncbi:MAG: diguanylate cyclase [Holophagaceae bacterium]|nr:diguanylate cyclase [Holophagaceae bacterium]
MRPSRRLPSGRAASITQSIHASIGISLFPRHGTMADALINQADGAMYEAKRNRSGYSFAR